MRIYGLIGHPLTHAYSQRLFTERFAREGLGDHAYRLFDLPDVAGLPALLAEAPELCGLNVTIPHKQAVIPLLDGIGPLAAAVGAVNTISIGRDGTVGHNTDVEGFRNSLLPLLGNERPRALVLGSGGASRAVAFVLRDLGIRFRVVSRSQERGDLLWDMLDPIIVRACPLVINTTPLGMHPDTEGLPPLPYDAVGPRHLLVDLVYNPERTRFLEEGARRGSATLNGMPMLVGQADAAWRIWQEALSARQSSGSRT
jgi:shikimate dehydrogenase